MFKVSSVLLILLGILIPFYHLLNMKLKGFMIEKGGRSTYTK